MQLTVLTIDADAVTSEDELQTALEFGVLEVARALVTQTRDRSRRVAVDIRASHSDTASASHGALIQAVRGMVQAYTLESGADVPPVNIILSERQQETDRELTWTFLADVDGGMARGATFDLRESA